MNTENLKSKVAQRKIAEGKRLIGTCRSCNGLYYIPKFLRNRDLISEENGLCEFCKEDRRINERQGEQIKS